MSASQKIVTIDGKRVEVLTCQVCGQPIYVEPGKGGGDFSNKHFNCLNEREREDFLSDGHMDEVHARYGLD